MNELGKAMTAAVEAETAPLLDQIADMERQLAEAQGLAANLAQRLQEAKDRKVLLNGMTQEQKAAIFDIKAIVSDGVRHYDSVLAALAQGKKGD